MEKITEKTEYFAEDMNLKQIAASGQCFRMEEREEGLFSLIAGERYLEIQCLEKGKFIFFCKNQEFFEFWYNYFDLSRDYGKLKEKIDPEDTYLKKAAEFGWGIRILRQDLWEMTATFILSQQNNIPRIRRCVRLICEKYGEKRINFRGEEYFSFPSPEALAGADLEGLKACNLGYRARYIQETAAAAAEGKISLDALKRMDYEEAKKELMKLCGIGKKVADCICLFALHHVEAFPVDTHVSQLLAAHYPNGFPFWRYPGFAGILQQYMFYYEVSNKTHQ